MVHLTQMTPMYIDAYVPQDSLTGVKLGNQVVASTSLYPKRVFKGVVTAIGSVLDVNTRSVLVRTKFANQDHQLLPGMYLTVNILFDAARSVIVIPQTAIIYHSYGDSVYVVHDGKVKSQYVRVGQRYNNSIIIDQGLKVGDQVVIAGQNKLHDGAVVKIDNKTG